MSDCENELEYWRTLAKTRTAELHAAKQENIELRRTIDVQRDDAAVFMNAGQNGLETLREQREKYRQERDKAWADIDEFNARYSRYRKLEEGREPGVLVIFEETPDGTVQRRIQEQPLRTYFYATAVTHDGNVATMQGPGIFPGNVEAWEAEMERVLSLITRSPMKEDLRRAGMEYYGIDQKMLLDAIGRLAPFVYIPELHDQYGRQLDLVFRTYLKPHIEKHNFSDARAAFRKAASETYDKLGNNRGFQLKAPRLKAGAKAKSESD